MLENTLQRLAYTYRGGPRINYAKCIGCGECYEVCPPDIFAFDRISGLIKVIYPDDCWYCGACIYECPAKGAIELELPMACL